MYIFFLFFLLLTKESLQGFPWSSCDIHGNKYRIHGTGNTIEIYDNIISSGLQFEIKQFQTSHSLKKFQDNKHDTKKKSLFLAFPQFLTHACIMTQ